MAGDAHERDGWAKVKDTFIHKPFTMGPHTTTRFIEDPKRLGFMLARYKFAAKMVQHSSRLGNVLEVGCGEGFGTLLLAAELSSIRVTGWDQDEEQIGWAQTQEQHAGMRAHFIGGQTFPRRYSYEGVVCLDVLEHIPKEDAYKFLMDLAFSLSFRGVVVIGTPNAHAAQYASIQSQIGHVNLYDPDRLLKELTPHFANVFMFSMNDEVVHTGFNKLAHYLFAVCVR